MLQLSLAEPAVKHAVLGLSALHRRAECDHGDSISKRWRQRAFIQYGITVSETRQLIQRAQQSIASSERTAVLATCLLLSIFDSLTGNYEAAQAHLQSALRLATEHGEKPSGNQPRSILPSTDETYNEVTNLLERLDLQAQCCEVRHAVYSYQTAPVYDMTTPLPRTFSRFSEARQHLIRIILALGRLAAIFDESCDASTRMLTSGEYAHCVARFVRWQTAFDDLVTRAETLDPSFGTDPVVSLLKAYQCIANILIGVGFFGPETRWDCFISDFKRTVDYCELIICPDSAALRHTATSYQMEQGPLMPLFVVASRCRDPVIRRRAITLMSDSERIEGTWDSRGLAALSRRMAEIEEESDDPVTCAADIPLEARILATLPRWDWEKRRMDIQFWRKNAEGAYNETFETVFW